jgi:hypothetical protein
MAGLDVVVALVRPVCDVGERSRRCSFILRTGGGHGDVTCPASMAVLSIHRGGDG